MKQLLVAIVLAFLQGSPGVSTEPPLVFSHVNVIDGNGGPVQRDMTVVVLDGRIAAIRRSDDAQLPAAAQVIDASGKYLIPGLWDMHVHWYDEPLLGLFVANGVTGVRQMWGMPLHLGWRDRIAAGGLVGPRFAIASTIVDGPNPVWAGSRVVADENAARQAVRDLKRDGYDFVKVYNRLPRDAYFALAAEAKVRGLPFDGHVPMAVTATEASDAGQRSIEHLDGILYGSSREEDALRKRNRELSTGGEASKGIDPATRALRRELRERLLATYDPSRATALFARFVKNGTWQCPTLTVLRSMASLDDPTFTSDPRLKYMPQRIRNSWKPANNPRLASKTRADYLLDRRSYRKHLEIVGAMRRAGVKFLAGTDVLNPFAFPGFSLHDELALLVEAGLTPMDALQAATINPAVYLGQSKSLGTIETGKVADLVLLEANPLDDIAHTKRITAVITAGRLRNRSDLDAMLAWAEDVANRQ